MFKTLVGSFPWGKRSNTAQCDEEDIVVPHNSARISSGDEVVFRVHRAANGFVIERHYSEFSSASSHYELRVVNEDADIGNEIVASLAGLKMSRS